jgi:hypothetical protein
MFCVRLSRISVTTGHLTWASETRPGPAETAASETRSHLAIMCGRCGTEAAVESVTATCEPRRRRERAPSSASGFRAGAFCFWLIRQARVVELTLVGLELESSLGTLSHEDLVIMTHPHARSVTSPTDCLRTHEGEAHSTCAKRGHTTNLIDWFWRSRTSSIDASTLQSWTAPSFSRSSSSS